MSTFLYLFDDATGKPKISTVNSSNVLTADGLVGLTGTWAAGAHQIQVSVDPSNANDLTRKSWVDGQIAALVGPFGAKNKFVGVANGVDPAGVSIGSRFLVVGAYSTYSVGDVIEQKTVDPTFEAVVVADGDVYVSTASLTGSAACTSDSSTIDDGEICVWDTSTSKWITIGSIYNIAEATSGSGGGTKGIVTADSDKGLLITTGIMEVKIIDTRLQFTTGSLDVKEGGIDHANLTNLDSANYSHLSSTQKTDLTDSGDSTLHYHSADRNRANHTGTQAASTISDFNEAAQDAAALALTSGTNSTIIFTYSDAGDRIAAEVKDDSITSAKLGSIVVANQGLKQTDGALGVDYDNVTIGIVNNKLAVLNSGEVCLSFTNNTGSQIDAGSVVALSTTVAGEIVLADANDADIADAIGVVKSNIADEASGNVIIKGEATVLTDGNNFDLGKWVYVGGDAASGKASKLYTGSYYQVKLGQASATTKVVIEKQWIG